MLQKSMFSRAVEHAAGDFFFVEQMPFQEFDKDLLASQDHEFAQKRLEPETPPFLWTNFACSPVNEYIRIKIRIIIHGIGVSPH